MTKETRAARKLPTNYSRKAYSRARWLVRCGYAFPGRSYDPRYICDKNGAARRVDRHRKQDMK